MSSRLQFIDSSRFMTYSLSNLVTNITEEIHKIECKYGQDNVEFNVKLVSTALNLQLLKMIS